MFEFEKQIHTKRPLPACGITPNIAECIRVEESTLKLNRALRLLSKFSMLLVRSEDEQTLLDTACRLIVEAGGHMMAWIGYAEQDAEKSVRPIAQFGHDDGYLNGTRMTWAETELGMGPTGTAIRTGETQVNHEYLSDPHAYPWRDEFLKRGYQASIALPISLNGATLGALSIYSAEAGAFEINEIKLLEELAGNLAYGIEMLRMRAVKARADNDLNKSYFHLEELVQKRTEQLQAKDMQLLEALSLNQNILMTSVVGMAAYRQDGRCIMANPSFIASVGGTEKEVLSQNFRTLRVWQESGLLEWAEKVLATGVNEEHEFHSHSSFGHELWVHCQLSRFVNLGEPHLLLMIRDISEERQAGMALKDSEQKFRLLFEESNDCNLLLSADGLIIDVNHVGHERLGYAKQEMLGRYIAEFVAPGYAYKVSQRLTQIMNDGHARFESAHIRKDGSTMLVEVNCRLIELDGRPVCYSVIRDIAERKWAEQALQESKARLSAMLDNLPFLTWLKDTEGRYIEINKVFADFLHLEYSQQAIGKTDFDLQPRELAEKFRADDALVMAERKQKYVEGSAFDGQNLRWVEAYKAPIIDKSGKLLGTVGIARDITERKLIDKKLSESESNLKALVENIKSGVAVFRASADGRDFFLTAFNRAAERIEKLRREELIGKNVEEVFPGIAESGLLDVFRRVWESGVAEHLPLSFYQDGRIAAWRENYVYKLPNGEIVAIYDDVTERKKAEQEIFAINARPVHEVARQHPPFSAFRSENKKKVLVIEDHPIVRNAIRQLIEREADEFVVEGEACDGVEAVEMAISGNWDIVLLDINLPKKGGIRVLEEVMAVKPDLPIIMISSHAKDKYGEEAISKGAACYIEKGEAEKLVEAMRHTLSICELKKDR